MKGTMMDRLGMLVLLLVPLSVSAAALPCRIRPAPDTPAAALPGLVTVSPADAQHAALARLKAPAPQVAHGALEMEYGCLVSAFDIRIAGKRGMEEILVDAGTGTSLSHTHESPKQEAAERAKDNGAGPKPQHPSRSR
jgi:hypothetical protein